MQSGHRTIDHTADMALEMWAPDEPALLIEAARGLIEAITEGESVESRVERTVCLEAVDGEDRLVRWLNEVLWLATSEGFLLAEAQVKLTDEGLEAVIGGEAGAWSKIRSELKSVTYHDLKLLKNEAGHFEGRVIVDV